LKGGDIMPTILNVNEANNVKLKIELNAPENMEIPGDNIQKIRNIINAYAKMILEEVDQLIIENPDKEEFKNRRIDMTGLL
jgi:hypothetical protein